MPAAAMAHSHWRPDADVVETVGSITVTVELAGVDEEDVAVLLFEDALVIEGRRELPRCEGTECTTWQPSGRGRSGSRCHCRCGLIRGGS